MEFPTPFNNFPLLARFKKTRPAPTSIFDRSLRLSSSNPEMHFTTAAIVGLVTTTATASSVSANTVRHVQLEARYAPASLYTRRSKGPDVDQGLRLVARRPAVGKRSVRSDAPSSLDAIAARGIDDREASRLQARWQYQPSTDPNDPKNLALGAATTAASAYVPNVPPGSKDLALAALNKDKGGAISAAGTLAGNYVNVKTPPGTKDLALAAANRDKAGALSAAGSMASSYVPQSYKDLARTVGVGRPAA